MTYQNNYSSYNKSYGNRVYSPKKPIRSFEDLEVYQKGLSYGVGITRRVDRSSEPGLKLSTMALAIAIKIATAHSLRFGDGVKASQTLEEAMLACNLTVVLLEQYRDLWNESSKIEATFFEEHVKGLLALRGKMLRLQMSWKKFTQEKSGG